MNPHKANIVPKILRLLLKEKEKKYMNAVHATCCRDTPVPSPQVI